MYFVHVENSFLYPWIVLYSDEIGERNKKYKDVMRCEFPKGRQVKSIGLVFYLIFYHVPCNGSRAPRESEEGPVFALILQENSVSSKN